MNILSKGLIPLLFISMIFSGCYYDIINSSANIDFLKHKNGNLVSDCTWNPIAIRGGGAERFWKENNLPKGTTEFVCKNGKAYLPNQVPSN